eukprot:299655-Chlamydomonas_euryale.AAC.1
MNGIDIISKPKTLRSMHSHSTARPSYSVVATGTAAPEYTNKLFMIQDPGCNPDILCALSALSAPCAPSALSALIASSVNLRLAFENPPCSTHPPAQRTASS